MDWMYTADTSDTVPETRKRNTGTFQYIYCTSCRSSSINVYFPTHPPKFCTIFLRPTLHAVHGMHRVSLHRKSADASLDPMFQHTAGRADINDLEAADVRTDWLPRLSDNRSVWRANDFHHVEELVTMKSLKLGLAKALYVLGYAWMSTSYYTRISGPMTQSRRGCELCCNSGGVWCTSCCALCA